MPRREPTGQRRREYRVARSRVLVVCGAAKTEERYFIGLRDSVANRAVDVTIIKRPKDPSEVVNYAIAFADRSMKDFDEVWCVFDVDQFDIRPAVEAGEKACVELGISNPCFELWLLLHHSDCQRHLDDYREVEELLKRHLTRYDKTNLRFSDFVGGVAYAISRAKVLEPTGRDFSRNPSTSVWRLAEKIMENR